MGNNIVFSSALLWQHRHWYTWYSMVDACAFSVAIAAGFDVRLYGKSSVFPARRFQMNSIRTQSINPLLHTKLLFWEKNGWHFCNIPASSRPNFSIKMHLSVKLAVSITMLGHNACIMSHCDVTVVFTKISQITMFLVLVVNHLLSEHSSQFPVHSTFYLVVMDNIKA